MINNMKLKEKIQNSKFSFTKNSLYFLIAPLVIFIIGLVLMLTVGFNYGTDFTGGRTFKVYVNNDGIVTNADSKKYDLNNTKDYDTVYSKIKTILDDNGLKIVEYKKTAINVTEYNVYGGQAVEVVYQNNFDNANEKDEAVRDSLITSFRYEGFENSITTIDKTYSEYTFNWTVGVLAAIVFALLAAMIYLSFRYDRSAGLIAFIQVAFDLFLTLSLIAICRLTINLTVGIVLLSTFVISLANIFAYYVNVKSNFKQGKYEGMKNSEIANYTIKENLLKKIFAYSFLMLVAIMFSALAVEGVREVALGIMIALVVTFYSSQFILPAAWSTIFKKKKKKTN